STLASGPKTSPTNACAYIIPNSNNQLTNLSFSSSYPFLGRTINGHTLVDLVPPHDNLHKLAVTKAVLWARLTYNRSAIKHLPNRKPVFDGPVTLYIFKVDKSRAGSPDNRPMAIYPTPFFQASTEGDAADPNSGISNTEWNPMTGANET